MLLRCTRTSVIIVAFFIVSSLILFYQILHLGLFLPSRHLINLSGATSDRFASSSHFTNEYEDDEYYHTRAYTIPDEPYRIQSRSSGPVRSSGVVFAQPPPRHDDCVIDFTNVQIIDGEKIVIYADPDDVYADLARVGNVGVYENRASLSLFGNPLSPMLSIQFEVAPHGQTSYNTSQCRTHTTKPTFIFSARDHVLAHPSRHALFPVSSSKDWEYEQNETMAPTSKASSKVHPFDHPHGNAIRDSRHDANWAVRKWIKNNALIPYGNIYSAYDVRYESFTHDSVRPLNPESQDSMDEWKGIHCFDQLTLSISTNISIHNRIHRRSELQPLLDFMDDAYQIRTEYSARQLGWKYFKASLESARPLLIFSYRKYPQRFLHNETLIMEIVESVGFRMEIVSFGKLETKTMIETMRRAHVLMGVHGAGLSNSVFLHAGATMFLLMNPQHPVQKNPLARMAKNVGANYIELEIYEYPDGSCYINDFVKFKQKLEQAMRHVERLASSTTWSPPAIPEVRPIYPFPINYCAVRQWHSSYD